MRRGTHFTPWQLARLLAEDGDTGGVVEKTKEGGAAEGGEDGEQGEDDGDDGERDDYEPLNCRDWTLAQSTNPVTANRLTPYGSLLQFADWHAARVGRKANSYHSQKNHQYNGKDREWS